MASVLILEEVVAQVEVDVFHGLVAGAITCDGFGRLPLEQTK